MQAWNYMTCILTQETLPARSEKKVQSYWQNGAQTNDMAFLQR